MVIQTYEPEHYAIRHASRQDYEGFYQEEISYRKMLMYPPASHMLAVQIMSRKEDHALLLAGQIREYISRKISTRKDCIVIGPASASIGKVRDEYRYVVYIKTTKYDILIGCKDGIEDGMEKYHDAGKFTDTQVQFDFNPVSPF